MLEHSMVCLEIQNDSKSLTMKVNVAGGWKCWIPSVAPPYGPNSLGIAITSSFVAASTAWASNHIILPGWHLTIWNPTRLV